MFTRQNLLDQYQNNKCCSSNKRRKYTLNNTTDVHNASKSALIDEKTINKQSFTSTELSTKRKQFAGLRNLGSTCYINCIIQVIRYSPGFLNAISRLVNQINYLKSLNAELEREISNNDYSMFVKDLHELLIEMSCREKLDRRAIYSPRQFVNTVWRLLSFWSNGTQQDAHEFLQYTIHFINECELYLKKLHQQYQFDQQQQQHQLNLNSEADSIVIEIPNTRKRKQSNSSNEELTSSLFQTKSINSMNKKQNSKFKINHSTNYLRRPTKGGASMIKINSIINNNTKIETFFQPLKENDIKTESLILDSVENIDYILHIDSTIHKNNQIYKTKKEEKLSKSTENNEYKSNDNINSSNQLKSSVISIPINNEDQSKNELLSNKKFNQNSFDCIDDIITISQNNNLKLNLQHDNLNYKSLRSKLRSSKENVVTNQITSPAELLRKYSSVQGHICEMDKLFKASSETITQCLSCENLRKCSEAFYDRSLPVNTISNESMDLEWIMKNLINESYLDDDSKYMCDKCSSKQEAKIYTQYPEMPNILVLHLLSYGITSSNNGNLNTQKLNSRSKLLTCFDCLCEKCLNKNNVENRIKYVFKLYAVVMHSGRSLNHGHYTTFINYQEFNKNFPVTNLNKTEDNNSNNLTNPVNISFKSNDLLSTKTNNDPEWLHFDDSRVKLISNNEFQRKIIDSNYDSPYILFYVKDKLLST